jgi:hypothetical protein
MCARQEKLTWWGSYEARVTINNTPFMRCSRQLKSSHSISIPEMYHTHHSSSNQKRKATKVNIDLTQTHPPHTALSFNPEVGTTKQYAPYIVSEPSRRSSQYNQTEIKRQALHQRSKNEWVIITITITSLISGYIS